MGLAVGPTRPMRPTTSTALRPAQVVRSTVPWQARLASMAINTGQPVPLAVTGPEAPADIHIVLEGEDGRQAGAPVHAPTTVPAGAYRVRAVITTTTGPVVADAGMLRVR